MWDTPAFVPLLPFFDMSLTLLEVTMHPGLLELSVVARLADLERERQHNRLLAQVPKSQRLSRLIAHVGSQIIAFGTWMQKIEAVNA